MTQRLPSKYSSHFYEKMRRRYVVDRGSLLARCPWQSTQGKTRTELEELLGGPQETSKTRTNVGEATLYGVYFDDSEYDYMQHLRPVGVAEDGVESMLVEAPSSSSKQATTKKSKGIQLKDLPDGVLASQNEIPKESFYETQQAIPSSLAGFQPDMDPHLRQVLEALEDDAFVDNHLVESDGADFFEDLVADGERDEDEAVEFEFDEWGAQDGVQPRESDEGWEGDFKKFKKSRDHQVDSDDELEDGASEAADTVASLPMTVSVLGGSKRRRKRREGSDASGYSMSSSSLGRSANHQILDEAFDQVSSLRRWA